MFNKITVTLGLSSVVALGVVLAPAGLFAQVMTSATSSADCDVSFNSSVAVPAGYGAAYDFASGATLVGCADGGTTVNIGTGSQSQYIYNKGYAYKNGAWQEVALNAATPAVSSSWLLGMASSTLPFTNTELSNWNYIAAYVCSWNGSAWKCGCSDNACATPHWQIQGVKWHPSTTGAMTKFVGMADNQSTVTLRVGDSVALNLGSSLDWGTATVDQPSVLVKTSGTGQGVFRAAAAGTAHITLSGGAHCAPGTACPMFLVQYQLTVVVTGTGGGTISAPVITSLTPASGPAGTTVTINGTGFLPTGNMITFGTPGGRHHPDGSADNVIATAVSANGTTLTFTVPTSGPSGILCDAANTCIAIASILLQPGAFDVSVVNNAGTSNHVSFTMIAAGTNLTAGTLTGVVMVGPTCPVQSATPTAACADKTLQHNLLLKDASGNTVQTITVAADGTFSLQVAPGTYTFADATTQMLPRLTTGQSVTVTAGMTIQAVVNFDSGIR